jgi:hypothetical protein
MRCNPAYSGNASCCEIPDAIGWTSRGKFYGSIVVECKTSRGDFLADKKKCVRYRPPQSHFTYSGRRIYAKEAQANGWLVETIERMGDFRYFMCESAEVIAGEDILKHAPDHGLLYVQGRRIHVEVEAPRREKVDYPSEVHYLRFAIVNRKFYESENTQSEAFELAGGVQP